MRQSSVAWYDRIGGVTTTDERIDSEAFCGAENRADIVSRANVVGKDNKRAHTAYCNLRPLWPSAYVFLLQ